MKDMNGPKKHTTNFLFEACSKDLTFFHSRIPKNVASCCLSKVYETRINKIKDSKLDILQEL